MDVLMEDQDIVAGADLHDLGVEGSLALVPLCLSALGSLLLLIMLI
jgi:hypothetical protein